MKKLGISILFFLLFLQITAQKYYTKEGVISFYSDAPLEKIKATNTKATSVFDMETGAMEWAVLIKAFEFKKALMEEHFNENYLESTKYPKSTFKGSIKDLQKLDFSKNGEVIVDVEGTLNIHGIEKEVQTVAKFTITDGIISAHSELNVLVADYEIDIPALVRDNIAKEVRINIEASYKQL